MWSHRDQNKEHWYVNPPPKIREPKLCNLINKFRRLLTLTSKTANARCTKFQSSIAAETAVYWLSARCRASEVVNFIHCRTLFWKTCVSSAPSPDCLIFISQTRLKHYVRDYFFLTNFFSSLPEAKTSHKKLIEC